MDQSMKNNSAFTFKKIFILFDLSDPSKAALEWGLRMGSDFQAEVEVLHVLMKAEPPAGAHWERDMVEMRAHIHWKIEEEIRLILGEKAKLLSSKVQILEGKSVTALLEAIEKGTPDLVVLGTHGWTGAKHFLLGSVAEKIIRHSPAPVFVAKKGPAAPLKSILIPVDFSDSSDTALKLAEEFSQKMPVPMDLAHVIQFNELVGYASESFTAHGAAVNMETLEKAAKAQLEQMIVQYPKLKLTPHTLIGPPAAEICRLAKERNAGMILIPTHGRTGASRFFLGSVAEQVIRYAPCHVLSFRPKK